MPEMVAVSTLDELIIIFLYLINCPRKWRLGACTLEDYFNWLVSHENVKVLALPTQKEEVSCCEPLRDFQGINYSTKRKG